MTRTEYIEANNLIYLYTISHFSLTKEYKDNKTVCGNLTWGENKVQHNIKTIQTSTKYTTVKGNTPHHSNTHNSTVSQHKTIESCSGSTANNHSKKRVKNKIIKKTRDIH